MDIAYDSIVPAAPADAWELPETDTLWTDGNHFVRIRQRRETVGFGHVQIALTGAVCDCNGWTAPFGDKHAILPRERIVDGRSASGLEGDLDLEVRRLFAEVAHAAELMAQFAE